MNSADMVDSVREMFSIIQENDLLQTSLQNVLTGSNIVEDITSILNYVNKYKKYICMCNVYHTHTHTHSLPVVQKRWWFTWSQE